MQFLRDGNSPSEEAATIYHTFTNSVVVDCDAIQEQRNSCLKRKLEQLKQEFLSHSNAGALWGM